MALKAQNTISGKEGRLFLDGEEMAHIKTFEANVEKNKSEVNIMGRRMTGHKTTGANGTGTATFYKVTSKFVLLMMDYVKKGSDPYFTLKPCWMINPPAGAQSELRCMTSTLTQPKSQALMSIQKR